MKPYRNEEKQTQFEMKTLLFNPKNLKNLIKGVIWEPLGQNYHIPPPNLSALQGSQLSLCFLKTKRISSI